MLQNKNRIWRFYKRFLSSFVVIKTPIIFNTASFTSQNISYRNVKEAVLLYNSECFRVLKRLYCNKEWLYDTLILLHNFFNNSITHCITVCYLCTLKTQEFRTKDFFVRRTRSIERQKCKYKIRSVAQNA